MSRLLLILGAVFLAVLLAPMFSKELTIVDAPFQLEKVVHVRVPVDYNLVDSDGVYLLNFDGSYPYIVFEVFYEHNGAHGHVHVLFDARDGSVLATGDRAYFCGRDPVSGAYLFSSFVIVDGELLEFNLPDCSDVVGQYASFECGVSPIAYRDGYLYYAFVAVVSDEEGAFGWDVETPVEFNFLAGLLRQGLGGGSLEVLHTVDFGGPYVCPSGRHVWTCMGLPQVDFYGSVARVFVSYYTADQNYFEVWELNYAFPDEFLGKDLFLRVEGVSPRGGRGLPSYVHRFADGGYFVATGEVPSRVFLPGGVADYSSPFDVITDMNGLSDYLYHPSAVVREALVFINSEVPNDVLTRIGYYTSDATVHVFLSFRRDELGLQWVSSLHLAEYDGNSAVVSIGDLLFPPYVPPELNDPENMDGYLDAYIFSYNKPVVLPANLADYVSLPIATGPLEIVLGETSSPRPPAEVPRGGGAPPGRPSPEPAVEQGVSVSVVQPASPVSAPHTLRPLLVLILLAVIGYLLFTSLRKK